MSAGIITANIASSNEKERFVREHDFLVSKTDTKGIIKYANQAFIEVSGYSELELIGKNHNIIRHKDMPGGVFRYLWAEISIGNEVFCYVKNKSKDSFFYWVFANVTPSYNSKGNIIGYYSVRRAPKKSAIKEIEKIYSQLMNVEKQYSNRKEAARVSMEFLSEFLSHHNTSYDKLISSL